MLEEEMVDNLVQYFTNHNIRADREVKTRWGYVDIYLPKTKTGTIIEVKRDVGDLHTALGQVLTYKRDLPPVNGERKLIIVTDVIIPDHWKWIFDDYGIETMYYNLVLEDYYDIAEFGEILIEQNPLAKYR